MIPHDSYKEDYGGLAAANGGAADGLRRLQQGAAEEAGLRLAGRQRMHRRRVFEKTIPRSTILVG